MGDGHKTEWYRCSLLHFQQKELQGNKKRQFLVLSLQFMSFYGTHLLLSFQQDSYRYMHARELIWFDIKGIIEFHVIRSYYDPFFLIIHRRLLLIFLHWSICLSLCIVMQGTCISVFLYLIVKKKNYSVPVVSDHL